MVLITSVDVDMYVGVVCVVGVGCVAVWYGVADVATNSTRDNCNNSSNDINVDTNNNTTNNGTAENTTRETTDNNNI